MLNPKAPGVYVEEISTLPPSVADVATAVPAFIGYTEIGPADGADPLVVQVASMLEFRTAFGGQQRIKFTLTTPAAADGAPVVQRTAPANEFSLYYALRLYFANGGGPCYVVSIGTYGSAPAKARFSSGLAALEKYDEPTLIVLTDAASVLATDKDYYDLCAEALQQCKTLGDRFTIVDVRKGDTVGFRNGLPSVNLMYGAAYHPYLLTSIAYEYDEGDVTIAGASDPNAKASGTLALGGADGLSVSYSGPASSSPSVAITAGTTPPVLSVADGKLTISGKGKTASDIVAAWNANKLVSSGYDVTAAGAGTATIDSAGGPIPTVAAGGVGNKTLAGLKNDSTALYNRAKVVLEDQRVVLPPSPAIAGIYARVDREQGVWKAPANVGVLGVLGPVSKITNATQEALNIDPDSGKSINAIRDFAGKGTLVWGARTLAGNDNEWRYISVRRLFITIEESSKKASAFAVFEPNDQGTWLKVKAMIESYLYGLWEQGALAGAKPEAAYYVHVGLGSTMTPQDVLEGRLIVQIGIAAVRPAEFVILRFSHKLQTA
jgi:phage tail sheath protein FI